MSKNLSIRGARVEFKQRFIQAVSNFQRISLLTDSMQSRDDHASGISSGGKLGLADLFAKLPVEIVISVFSFFLGGGAANRELGT
jgi:hypothetical protein